MLAHVDPYGDTIFNRMQMSTLVEELLVIQPNLDGTALSTARALCVLIARAMFQGGASRFSDDEISQRVEVRLQRQQILSQDNPPTLWFILDEAVVRRRVGGVTTLAEQLRHIAEVAALPHVDVQVVPFAVGAHPGTPGSFIVLRFPEPSDPSVVYIETMAGDLYPEATEDIDAVALAFDRLRAMVLGPEASAELIRKAAKELT